jgi:hypothetical protein
VGCIGMMNHAVDSHAIPPQENLPRLLVGLPFAGGGRRRLVYAG